MVPQELVKGTSSYLSSDGVHPENRPEMMHARESSFMLSNRYKDFSCAVLSRSLLRYCFVLQSTFFFGVPVFIIFDKGFIKVSCDLVHFVLYSRGKGTPQNVYCNLSSCPITTTPHNSCMGDRKGRKIAPNGSQIKTSYLNSFLLYPKLY